MNKKAFSILELSIVVICMSIFISMSLQLILLLNSSKVFNTETKIKKINTALEEYVSIHNSLPCPSDIKLKSTDINYGVESLDNSDGCKTGSGVFKHGNIYVGGVPIKPLNLSISDSIDAWGNKIIYSVYDDVTEKYTEINTDFCVAFTGKNGSYSKIDNVYYVIISNGKNMFGAIPKDGSSNIRMSSSYDNRPELANIFSTSTFSSGTPSCINVMNMKDRNFDDMVEFGIYNHNLVKKINSEY